ncbi:hypothetical protein Tsubulata_028077 [Turnera subulata]|uniref:F-box domain-containing protein n=1 Tax=Turnera subulata TaxID=218843 RepID=A0A9Q0GL58_9ROSI|nr:hypothetical protein Tsubulata_028077 [Turnera subulata]
MAAIRNLWLSSALGSSNKRKRDERLLVDEAKTSTTTSTNTCALPSEIVEEILSLLPNKFIHGFRSLSKSWSSLLVGVDFLHQFRRNSTPPAAKILKLRCRYYGSLCDPSHSPSHAFALSPYYPSNALRHTANTKESYPYQKFWLRRKLSDSMITWFDRRYAHGFGYDSASDDYKVFVATRRRSNNGGAGVRVDIFSLKAAIYVLDSGPIISVKDGGCIGLQYFMGFVDVLEWIDNNPDGGSYEFAGEQYSKKELINFYRNRNLMAIPYTEALTSPDASTCIHPSRNF